MMPLRTQLALRSNALGPADDQRVARAAITAGDLLGPGEGSIAGDRPAGGIMIERQRTAEIVNVPHHVRERFGHAVENAVLVEGPVHAALGARPVVADDVK